MSATRLLLMIHAALGFLSLVAFWIAIFAAKGRRVHIASGKAFVWLAYAIVATALVRCVCVIGWPADFLELSAEATAEARAQALEQFRAFYIFLAYLSLVTLASVRHGLRVVQTHAAPEKLRTPAHAILNALTFAAGLGAAVLGIATGNPIVLALSPVGIFLGLSNLHYMYKRSRTKMEWWYEHLGAMLGAGIAMHTAFLVFGLSRIVTIRLQGPLVVLPWILPTLVGVPAIFIWTWYYKKRFRENA